jgi:hypothetical protein
MSGEMTLDGTRICPKCRAVMISEEVRKHRHSPTYRLEGDILWVRDYDGKWYRHDLALITLASDESKHQNDFDDFRHGGNRARKQEVYIPDKLSLTN